MAQHMNKKQALIGLILIVVMAFPGVFASAQIGFPEEAIITPVGILVESTVVASLGDTYQDITDRLGRCHSGFYYEMTPGDRSTANGVCSYVGSNIGDNLNILINNGIVTRITLTGFVGWTTSRGNNTTWVLENMVHGELDGVYAGTTFNFATGIQGYLAIY